MLTIWQKKQLHEAVEKLDAHEESLTEESEGPVSGFWVGIAIGLGLLVWGYSFYVAYLWWKS